MSDFAERLAKIREEKQIADNVPVFCACCGKPHYHGQPEQHDKSCIFWEATNDE